MSVKHDRTCPRSRRGGRECTCGSEPLLYPGWEAEARAEIEVLKADKAERRLSLGHNEKGT